MRTAIFVNASTQVTISAQESGLTIEPWGGQAKPLSTTLVLPPGVYKISSTQPVAITPASAQVYVQSTSNDKNQFPDPPPAAFAGTTNATIEELRTFFTDARSYAFA